MKVFDIKCRGGHVFEGWFDSLEDMESQIAKGMLSCPVCGSEKLQRVPSTFAIGGKSGGADHEVAARLVGKALMSYMRDNFDDVGTSFASEALKMHYGAIEPRNIRGVSTEDEEKQLKNEGVSFFKVGAAGAPGAQRKRGGGLSRLPARSTHPAQFKD